MIRILALLKFTPFTPEGGNTKSCMMLGLELAGVLNIAPPDTPVTRLPVSDGKDVV